MRRCGAYGGDCYLYGMLAGGYCDLVIEVQLKPHDFMAVIPVVEGAGGRISDWRGEPLSTASDGRVVAAATETLWQQAVAELRALKPQPARLRSPLTAERNMRA